MASASDILAGDLIEVNIAGVGLVRCDANESAALGQAISDVSYRADSGGQVPGAPFVVTASAGNPGEARKVSSAQIGAAAAANSRLVGLADNTPGELADFDQAFWVLHLEDALWGPHLELTSGLARTTKGEFLLPTQPERVRVEILDNDSGPAVPSDGLGIEILLQRALDDNWASFGDLVISNTIDEGAPGTRRFIDILFSTRVSTDFPAKALLKIANKGGGPPQTFRVFKYLAIY